MNRTPADPRTSGDEARPPPRPPGLPIGQRSIRYHRPRAPFCGIGYCTNCLVRTEARLNIRACREGYPVDGVRPTSHAWPSPRWDLFAVFDGLFPHGIDTLRGFRRPAILVRAYQRVVRRLAGYDTPPAATARAPAPPTQRRACEVLVIGQGTAGRAVADELRRRGVDPVMTVDRDRRRSEGAASPDLGRATAVFLPPPDPAQPHPLRCYVARDAGGLVEIASRRVVVATGGYDASLLFAGNDRPGVVTADGAVSLASAGFSPFSHAIVFGDGPRARDVLARFPREIAAIVAPNEIGPDLVAIAADRGIPLYPRSLLVRAEGRRGVRRVALRARGGGPLMTLEADGVVLAHRRIPHPQLFFQCGARMRWDPRPAAYRPVTDPTGATTVPGVYAVGFARESAVPSDAEGGARRTAEAIAAGAPPPGPEPLAPAEPLDPPHPLLGYYRELLAELGGREKWIACPCEDVLLSEIVEANERGYRGIEVVKRYTGLGTGLCQGRYCLPDALLILSILEGRPPSRVGYITQRPPVVPTRLADLAGIPGPEEGPS